MTSRYVLVLLLASGFTAAAACRKDAAPAEPETPTLDVTSWTEKSELFMEYPPLVTGRSARFAVHLTKLADSSAKIASAHARISPSDRTPTNSRAKSGSKCSNRR